MGWVEHYDEGSGRTYYHNTDTNETSWTKPEGFGDDVDALMAAGDAGDWQEVHDEASGRTYYFNKSTNESSWTKPPGSM